jgi:hypothetical protein
MSKECSLLIRDMTQQSAVNRMRTLCIHITDSHIVYLHAILVPYAYV